MNKTAEQARLPKKLVLHKETLRLLTQPELLEVRGGRLIQLEDITLHTCGMLTCGRELSPN